MGEQDYITQKLFQPVSAMLYDWTGIYLQPFTVLMISVGLLAVIVLYFMKNA